MQYAGFGLPLIVVGVVALWASRRTVPMLGVPDQRQPHTVPTRTDDAEMPTLAGLGTRVEEILRMAERQAADCKREGEQELMKARNEAATIIARAEAEAAKITSRDPA